MIGYSRTAFRAGSFLMMTLCTWACMAASAAVPTPPTHYTLDTTRSMLRFTFTQAGAGNTGRFGKYTADLTFANDNLPASKLAVTIDVASLDTGDGERDMTLKGPDLFDVAKFPQAKYVVSKFVATGQARYEAQGKITIRNVTKDLKVPLTFQTKTEGGKSIGYLQGRVTIRRNDYGVGQGDWKSTEQVADEVQVSFSLRFTPAS
jgi:polyisoprenoid-binding protein YceI